MEQILLTETQNGIYELTINRPENLNALNPDLLSTIQQTFKKISSDSGARVVILTGTGTKAFVAGADIHHMAGLGARPIADYLELGQRTMREIELCPVPVIAAINGYALGGGLELALACDILFASVGAKLGQPEVNLGIIPGFGGTQRLIHRCGIGVARRLCYTGELVGADEGIRIGLLDKVAPQESLITEVKKYAQLIASKAPLAIRATKNVIRQSNESVLLPGLRLEVEKFLELFGSRDREEGMSAFLEKREAKFTGR